MVEHGYDRATSDHCMFVKKFSDGEFIILLLYVDDMLIVRRDTGKIDKLKKELSKTFEIKDLGSASQILSIKISRDRTNGKLWLSQESYIEKVLDKFNIGKAKPVSSPLGSHLKLSSKQSPSSSFLILAKNTGAVVKWILKYLRGTSKTCLCFGTDKPILVRCIDVAMAKDVDSRKSTSEAEYIAIIEASKELMWMKKFLQELGLQQERSKHIDVRYHWIRDALEMKLFCLKKIHTDENGSDMMTKPIPIEKLQFCRKQASLVEPLT
ncbi:Retrovirus-related Pol polyprotein from transposon TNT 1-94 [Vitis vinifera]|uniref:Retrovirus-related Pol polyprotein from transposon TNT 1-94 n=1 Tax=Vitis vinifera TaxID=29760 RepID=A0A438CQE7_VITVI|nr:Retrovirus-related Pol polyprotein from transposon TNT 1-94 [Vitis vinifera]